MSDQTAGAGWPRTAWLVVALLVPVALLNYLDRQMLAAMKGSMMADLPDIGNKANWGLVLGSFKWVYAILSPLGGFLSDRLNRRNVICASLLVWSAVTWYMGHVHSFHELLAARALMGVSEAFYIPAALALITEFHLGPTRSRAVGFHQMGGLTAGQVADAEAPRLHPEDRPEGQVHPAGDLDRTADLVRQGRLQVPRNEAARQPQGQPHQGRHHKDAQPADHCADHRPS